MIFGGIDHDQFLGDLHQFPLVNDRWWGLNFNSLVIGNEIIDLGRMNEAIAVIDTGTSMIGLPEDYYE